MRDEQYMSVQAALRVKTRREALMMCGKTPKPAKLTATTKREAAGGVSKGFFHSGQAETEDR